MSRETETPETIRDTAAPSPREREPEELVTSVRERYARIAERQGGCCGGAAAETVAIGVSAVPSEKLGYTVEGLTSVPEGADLGLGCGAPIPHLRLQPGETVLDLGSGGGLDALLAAREVGPKGRVIGVDMTAEMIRLARDNARQAGVEHVEFRRGRLEELPVADASVDAVTSNCVINLVPDKARVFREIARVLRPGGRAVISDIVLDGRLPEALERDLLAWVGCLAGAQQRQDYLASVVSAGLTEIEVLREADYLDAVDEEPTGEVAALLERTGVRLADLCGKVRSITYRAVKP